jgi:hypothetical protein
MNRTVLDEGSPGDHSDDLEIAQIRRDLDLRDPLGLAEL